MLRRALTACLAPSSSSCSARASWSGIAANDLTRAKERLAGIPGGEVSLSLSPQIAAITLRNSERKNALTPRMMLELDEVVSTLSSSWSTDGRVVMLQGEGGTFCSGADLAVVAKDLGTAEAGQAMCTLMHDITYRLGRLPQLTLSLLEGAAIGGGAELATATDWRFMHHNAVIQFVHARMGVSPGWGGGSRLTRLVGRSTALRLLAGGQRTSAHHALALGLVDGVLGDNDAHAAASAAAATVLPDDLRSSELACAALEWMGPNVLEGYTVSLQAIKQVVVAAADTGADVVQSAAVEREVFGSLWGGPASTQAIGARQKQQQ